MIAYAPTQIDDTAHRGHRAPVRPDQPRWAHWALAALLAATTAFWSIGLSASGWANSFYSAAVQAGTQSWTAFLFGSSDAANSITVDKPPGALWPMEISARIFGINSWSILLPEVLLGVASVALLYVIVKRQFGPAAGLIAGLVLALTPVASLMFRYNNPDALLAFLMVAAVWALMRAVEDGRTRWLVLCGALIGFGFLTKQLQVMLVVPALAATYLIAGPVSLRKRLAQLGAALGAMVVAAGWWVLIVTLTPAADRPYVGGSSDNSFLNLTFGYNGLGRLTGGDGPGGSMFGPEAGPVRLFTGSLGGQISWLLPAAMVFLIAGIVLCGRVSRTDAQRAQYVVWGGWLVGTAAVFSLMSGVFHDYYTVALAPPIAALVGIGAVQLWRRRTTRWVGMILAATTALTVGWSWILLGRTPDFVPELRWAVLVSGGTAAVGLLMCVLRPNVAARRRGLTVWAGTVAAVAALAGPLAYSVQTVATPHAGGNPTAGPTISDASSAMPAGMGFKGAMGKGDVTVSDQVTRLLSADAGSYTWVAATSGADNAAGFQLATGDPVMPVGGFSSSDPSPTLAQFQADVAAHQIHYYIAGGAGRKAPDAGSPGPASIPGFAARGGGPQSGRTTSESSKINDWVTQNYTPITVDGVTLYDLSMPTE